MNKKISNNRLARWLRRSYHKMMVWLYVGDGEMPGASGSWEVMELKAAAEKHFEALAKLDEALAKLNQDNHE